MTNHHFYPYDKLDSSPLYFWRKAESGLGLKAIQVHRLEIYLGTANWCPTREPMP